MANQNNRYSQKTLDLASELIDIRDAYKNDRKDRTVVVLDKLDYKNNITTEVYEFDAFLIKAVTDKFKNTYKFDIILMAFGLLDGYDYKKTSIGTRREKYLIESDYLKTNSREKVKSYIDANEEDKERLKDNLRNGPEKTNIEALADFLINKKEEEIEEYMNNIDGYIDKICNDKNSVLYSVKLPVPFYKQSQENTVPDSPNRPDIKNIRTDPVNYYIESIRFSEHHDDVAEKLYEALCGQGEPPYNKWVATWILKCIREGFDHTLDAEIMLASFALLDECDLKLDYKRRLVYFLNNSNYYETRYGAYSHRLGKSIIFRRSFITLLPSEVTEVLKKLMEDERALIDELVVYIKDIEDPQRDIKELNGYGKLVEDNSYEPYMQEMLYRIDHIAIAKKGATMAFIVLLLSIGGIFFVHKDEPSFPDRSPQNEQLSVNISPGIGDGRPTIDKDLNIASNEP